MTQVVWAVAFSPDGRQLATGCNDKLRESGMSDSGPTGLRASCSRTLSTLPTARLTPTRVRRGFLPLLPEIGSSVPRAKPATATFGRSRDRRLAVPQGIGERLAQKANAIPY